MKILVTGAAGFIGSNLCRFLLEKTDFELVAIDNFSEVPYPSGRKRINARLLQEEFEFQIKEYDITDRLPESLFQDVYAVVNTAALAGLTPSFKLSKDYFLTNALGVENLVEISERTRVTKFVQISTSSVYGTLAFGSEDMDLQPASPYGQSKIAGEDAILRSVERNALEGTILRLFSVYGPGQRTDMAFSVFFDALLRGREIEIYGDGRQTRTNTYVADVVSAIFSTLTSSEVTGEILNIGGTQELSTLQVLGIIEGIVGTSAQVIHRGARVGDQRHTKADISKAKRLLSYEPKTAISDGLARQFEYELAIRAIESQA